MQTGDDIRRAFLDYFAGHGHTVLPSSPLVPRNDPTLLFTNAGMVQFKNVFTGAETRPYSQATTSQKCLRAGGKHNDLDNVGYTARHHTFFEMLGNFSFGDYFKERAIELAWGLVAKELGLAQDRLWVTVYHDDDEAFGLWRRISGLPESRIVRIATSDNFWAMGDTGPCGPCSEIFYDHGPALQGGPPGSPDADGDRYVEIWNLVFMQYDQRSKSERVALPKPSIDTGMGLERITAVLQGKHDNYDTDLLRNLIEASAQATRTDPDGPARVSHRVIADHLRAMGFLVADGVLPSNDGRGYVLRRIMRRAMRHAHLIGCEEPVLYRLAPDLVDSMGRAYPELVRAKELIVETVRLEETRFHQTLARGLKILDEEVAKLGGGVPLPGEVAFRLYDTYGFPIDLTQDALRGRGHEVDYDGFNALMARQRTEARKAWAGSGEAATETVWFEIRQDVGATEFLGYDSGRAAAEIQAIVVDGKRVERAETGAKVAVVVNQTPFYGESGGQMGDTGTIRGASGAVIEVQDTAKKLGDLYVHHGVIGNGRIAVGETVELEIDNARRTRLRANHSATHLLHAALRRAFGPHVTQKGSLVAPERLRFDFSHPKPLSEAEIAGIEADVNRVVRRNTGVSTRLMTPAQAIDAGALALFGEKYGDEVRVVAMGNDEDAAPYSVELCGGTHARRTGDIGLFKIVAESGVAAGVRRIEALTGEAAEGHLNQEERHLRAAAAALKSPLDEVPARIALLIEERRKLERQLSEARRSKAAGAGPKTSEIGGVRYAAQQLDGVPPKDLRAMVDGLKQEIGSGVVALVAVNEGKAALVVGVTDDLTGRLSAVDLVRAGATRLGGKGGGGRPEFAQAGGPDATGAAAALEAVEAALHDMTRAA